MKDADLTQLGYFWNWFLNNKIEDLSTITGILDKYCWKHYGTIFNRAISREFITINET